MENRKNKIERQCGVQQRTSQMLRTPQTKQPENRQAGNWLSCCTPFIQATKKGDRQIDQKNKTENQDGPLSEWGKAEEVNREEQGDGRQCEIRAREPPV